MPSSLYPFARTIRSRLLLLVETFQVMPRGYVNSSARNILRRDLNRLAIPHNIISVHYIKDIMLNVSDKQEVSTT